MSDKLTKEEVHYGRGMVHSHCGPILRRDQHYCRHFEMAFQGQPYKQGACGIVTGTISPMGWCEKFNRAK